MVHLCIRRGSFRFAGILPQRERQEQKSVSLEKRAEATYAEFRRQKALESRGSKRERDSRPRL